MRYLSIDIEATGLAQDCLMIEFAMIPFDASTGALEESLAKSVYIQCPDFESLKPKLDPWVVEHNETLIRKAHAEGMPMAQFKEMMTNYLESPEVKSYFNNQKIKKICYKFTALQAPNCIFCPTNILV